jgi:hypothetical protein
VIRHYQVPREHRPAVARALLAAAANPDHDVKTSHDGFYADDDLWDAVADTLDTLLFDDAEPVVAVEPPPDDLVEPPEPDAPADDVIEPVEPEPAKPATVRGQGKK